MISKCSKHGMTEFSEPNINMHSYCVKCLKKEFKKFGERTKEAYSLFLFNDKRKISIGARGKVSKYEFINDGYSSK